MAQWLDPQAPMLARTLHEAGYATGHFGKWHMGGQRDVGEAPTISEYGFDESLTNFEGLGPRVLPLLDSYDGSEPQKYSLGSESLPTGPIRWEKRDQITSSFTEAAIEFIDKSQANHRPFYINVWPDDVHSPFFPPKERRGGASKKDLYSGVLKTMDEQLAPLFDRIRKDPSLRENTLIFVCSDNGPEEGAGSAGPFRGSKTTLYEGGIRSPLIVWGPKFVAADKAGSTNKSAVLAAIDFAPSILELVGVTTPNEVEYDGVTKSDTLLGKSDQSRERPLFFRRPPDRPSRAGEANLPDLAVRDGQWKLLCDYDGSAPQLYDLAADRAEETNLAATRPEIVQRLTAELLSWHASMPPDGGPTYVSLSKAERKARALSRSQN